MRIFLVLYEEDGYTVKAPGVSETEIKKVSRRIAADNIGQVWEHIKPIREDPERNFIGVWEEHPMVEVIGSDAAVDAQEKK